MKFLHTVLSRRRKRLSPLRYCSLHRLTQLKCPQEADRFPYLLVNCGSGVSILKVTGPESFERVSGSPLGGGALLLLGGRQVSYIPRNILGDVPFADQLHFLQGDAKRYSLHR